MASDKETTPRRSRRDDGKKHKKHRSLDKSPALKHRHKSSSSSHRSQDSSSASPSDKRRRRRSHKGKVTRSRSRSPISFARVSRERAKDSRERAKDSRERAKESRDRDDPNVCHCLGVFGLSSYTQEKDLKEVFGRYGEIEDICIIYDRQSGHSKGYGFVYYRSTSDAIEARKETQGLVLDRRPIRVDFSLTTRPHSPTPGRYMGRRSNRDLQRYCYRDNGDYEDQDTYRDSGRRESYRDRYYYNDYDRDEYHNSYDDVYCRRSRRFSPYPRRH